MVKLVECWRDRQIYDPDFISSLFKIIEETQIIFSMKSCPQEWLKIAQILSNIENMNSNLKEIEGQID